MTNIKVFIREIFIRFIESKTKARDDRNVKRNSSFYILLQARAFYSHELL